MNDDDDVVVMMANISYRCMLLNLIPCACMLYIQVDPYAVVTVGDDQEGTTKMTKRYVMLLLSFSPPRPSHSFLCIIISMLPHPLSFPIRTYTHTAWIIISDLNGMLS